MPHELPLSTHADALRANGFDAAADVLDEYIEIVEDADGGRWCTNCYTAMVSETTRPGWCRCRSAEYCDCGDEVCSECGDHDTTPLDDRYHAPAHCADCGEDMDELAGLTPHKGRFVCDECEIELKEAA